MVLLAFSMVFFSCSSDGDGDLAPDTESPEPDPQPDPDPDPILEVDAIPASAQRLGDPTAGYEYLVSGEYMSSGIPYDAYIAAYGEASENLLGRTGDNAPIVYDYTAATAPNSTRIVSPNCMACHADFLNGELIIGLGNHTSDYTSNRANTIGTVSSAIALIYGEDSKEWEAYDQFRKGILAIGPKTMTASRGVNPADKITQVLIAHRDKNTLAWSDEPFVEVDDEVIPTDVPAWWLLKKKNAMFYTGLGRRDFCKSFIGSSLLTLTELDKAEEVDQKMPDMLAYLYSLEPPPYPYDIDTDQSAQGKTIFEDNCVKCHGSYGEDESYPNLLVALNTIGTDPELSLRYTTPSELKDYFTDWFNNGWFGTYSEPLEVVAEGGYIAPPLDGIWATAPYFHNGSVPTLAEVLNSSERPTYWRRSFDSGDYDPDNLGWKYTEESGKTDKNTYDTTLKGYGNGGHTFADHLTETERKALLEYLKTL